MLFERNGDARQVGVCGIIRQMLNQRTFNTFKILVALSVTSYCLAQQIDTAISSNQQRPFTILDEVGDQKEVQTFLALYSEHDPRRKSELAQSFLRSYPQSWLLAPVNDIAAKAFIDLGDYSRALQYGRESIRLLPENVLLLVPLANVEAEQGLLAEARQTAHEALEYLDRFGCPSSISTRDWPKLERRLRASAYYALAKAETKEALAAAGSTRKERLRQAEGLLFRARESNPDDAETAYLLGLTEVGLGKLRDAALPFAQAYEIGGSLKAKALGHLEEIYQLTESASGRSFQEFLNQLLSQRESPKTPALPVKPQTSIATYAGSDACRICHAEQHSAWQRTGMGTMFRAYRPQNVVGDFETNNRFLDDDGSLLAHMTAKAGNHFFETRGDDGRWNRYQVDYTIGSKWQQAYATRLPDGRIHVFPLQYNRLHKRWINYWKIIDNPDSARARVKGFPELTPDTNYLTNCAPCHTSQLGPNDSNPPNTEIPFFREAGVNCEMCHGPSAEHVRTMLSGQPRAKSAFDPPVDFRRITSKQYVDICAQCHMQSAIRKSQPDGKINYSSRAEAFFPNYLSLNYIDFSRKAFYKDGRFRQTTFIVEAFVRSACFKKGEAHCGHCHDPHPSNASLNPTSLKFRDEPDRMCLPCHARYSSNIMAHTHHPASSEASRCVSCHMPRTMDSLLFQARSHQIEIPKADLTLRFGQQESPNACLVCHSTKDARWVKDRLEAWYPVR